MKAMVFLLSAMLVGSSLAFADILPPKQVVQKLIKGAQANRLDTVVETADLTCVYKGGHGRTPKDFIAFLQAIDLGTANLSGAETLSTPPLEKQSVVLDTPQLKARFDLELRRSDLVLGDRKYSQHEVPAKPPRYVVIEVHQHP